MPRHHFLPETYLRGFAIEPERRRIVAIRAGSGTWFSSGLSQVACQHDLYRVRTHPPETEARREFVEREFSTLESLFSSARERLEDTGTIGPDLDFSHLISFVGLLRFRTPAAIGDQARMFDASTKAGIAATICDGKKRRAAVEWYVSSRRGTVAQAEAGLNLLAEFSKYEMQPSQNMRVLELLECASGLTDVLLKMRWSVERAAGRYGFITSDFPVTISSRHAPLDHGIDPRAQGVEVVCPITSMFALVGRWTHERDEAVGTCRIDQVNRRTSWAAHQFLYGSSADPRYVTYAQEFSGAARTLVTGLPQRVDEDVARRGRLTIGLHALPVPWDPPRRVATDGDDRAT